MGPAPVTFLEAYEASAAALCVAIQQDANRRKALGQSAYVALLPTMDFHDRCFRMARFAVLQERPLL